jgi:hypothetical protein
MNITLYIPYKNTPYNIPFNKIEDLEKFCSTYQSKGILDNHRYIFNINKNYIGKLFFLIIESDNNILSIPIPNHKIDIFKLHTNNLNISIMFQHTEIFNTKKNFLFYHLGYHEVSYETKPIYPKIKQIIIEKQEYIH